MRTAFLLLGFVFLLSSCKKASGDTPTVNTVRSTLNNDLSKTWTLSKLFVNGTQMTLTPGQARYTKTYKVDNTWLDSDGYLGTYNLSSTQAMSETTSNAPGGTQTINYTIKACTTTLLDLEYTLGSTTYRLVFSV
jgi:hypothetical protein